MCRGERCDEVGSRSDAGLGVVLGDNGYGLFDTSDVLIEVASTDPAVGGGDTIFTGDGSDVVLGGTDDDQIDTGSDDSRDVVLGDNGTGLFDSVGGGSLLRDIRTSDAAHGGGDTIVTGGGSDVVFGGSAGDQIDTRSDTSRDVVLAAKAKGRWETAEG